MKQLIDVFDEISAFDGEYFIHHIRLEKVESTIHRHPMAQLLYAEGGIIHIFTDDKHWYLPARCFMIIAPDSAHSLLSFSPRLKLYNFYFKVDPERDPYFMQNKIYFAGELLREMIFHTAGWNGPIAKNSTPYYFLQGLKAILPELNNREIPFPVQNPFPKDEKLIDISRFLVDNIDQNYSLEFIAKRFGLSERTLSRKFKTDLGMNYVRFLRSLRIIKSLELLSENKYSTSEIATMVGYSSLSTFSNLFFKVLGFRPSDYQHLMHRKT